MAGQEVLVSSLVFFGANTAVTYGKHNILFGPKQSAGAKRLSIPGRKVTVINMLGIKETEQSIDKDFAKLVEKTGIHAFVFVLNLGSFNHDDVKQLECLQRMFGENVLQFVMILFTYEKQKNGDTIIDDLKNNPALELLLEKCRGRYHICNKSMTVQSDMTALLEKIDQMVSENGPSCYTAENYKTIEKIKQGIQRSKDQEIYAREKQKKQKSSKQHYNIILLGEKGAGKSSTGNTIVVSEAFSSKKMQKTQKLQRERVMIAGVKLDVYDIQGEFESGNYREALTRKLTKHIDESVPTVILLVIKPKIFTNRGALQQYDRLTSNYEKSIELLENLPSWLRQNTWFLFTRGDELERENLTIDELIEQSEELKTAMNELPNRCHVFNNKRPNALQVVELIEKIKEAQLKMAPAIVRFARIKETPNEQNPHDRRIVLLGKTGAGKSATANTILGEEKFKSELNPASVTAESEMGQGFVEDRNVFIVDTPGLFDTSMSAENLGVEIGRSVYLASPGPHAFLYVLQINLRFTEQEEEVVHKFEMMFGEEMRKYTIVLFSQGDQLEGKSADTLIKKNKSLNKLVEQCGGGYHIFNNKDLSNREQVTQLMEKIDTMVEKNDGSCYSNQMFQDAARFKKEEEERRRMEEEARKQKDEQQRQDEIERIRKDLEEGMRKENEREMKMWEEERKRRDKKQKQEEIKSIRMKKKEDARQQKARSVQLNQINYNYTQSSQTNMDSGFNRFYQKHENHLAAAGRVGTGRKIAVGAAAGVTSGALIGCLIGIVGGPPGMAIGAAIGAVVGAAMGTAGGALHAKLS